MTGMPSLRSLAALAAAATLGFGIRTLSHPVPSLVKGIASVVPGDSLSPLDKLLAESKTPERDRKLRDWVERIPEREIHSALVRLKAKSDDWVIHNLQLELLVRWIASDPKAALAWKVKGDGQTQIGATQLAAWAWAERDETAALEWMKQLSKRPMSEAARMGILGSIAARDPGRAVALLQSQPELIGHDGWAIVFSVITARNPQSAIAEALRIPEGHNRTEALKSIASLMGMSDPKGAENWIRQLPPGQARKEAMAGLIQMLIYEDPKEAIRISLNEKAAGKSQMGDLHQAVAHWALRDVDAARAWVDQLPHGRQRTTATLSLVITWSEKDPKAALDYALTSPDAPAKASATGAVLGQWLNDDFAQGMEWIDSQAQEIPPAVLLHAAAHLTWRNPANAAILLERLPDGEQRSKFYRNLAADWAKSNPNAATAWREKIPEGAGKEAFTKGFIDGTAATDLPAALKIFETLPVGATRNATATTIATALAKTDPRAALEWIDKPGSGGALEGAPREHGIKQVIGLWLKQDAAEAKAWINAAALPETQKQSLLKH